MKPYPLASLNHFTRPFAMLPYLVPFFGAAPLDAPRLYAGAPSAAEGKQKRRADWISRGVSFGLSGFNIRLNQNPEKDYTSRASGVNRLLPFGLQAGTRFASRASQGWPWRIAQQYLPRRPREPRRPTGTWAPACRHAAVSARISSSYPRRGHRRERARHRAGGWCREDGAADRFATSRRRRRCAHARDPPRAWWASRAESACCSRGRPWTTRATRRAHAPSCSNDRRCREAPHRRRA